LTWLGIEENEWLYIKENWWLPMAENRWLSMAEKRQLELAQYQQKVPFKQYKDLKSYLAYRPFSQIKNFRLIENCESQKVIRKQRLLSALVKENGFQHAYKILNTNSNFRRDYSSLIEEDKSIPDPNVLYQKNLQAFFMEESWQQKTS